jgi:hypothetical protein
MFFNIKKGPLVTFRVVIFFILIQAGEVGTIYIIYLRSFSFFVSQSVNYWISKKNSRWNISSHDK